MTPADRVRKKTVTVKVHEVLHRKAKIVCAHRQEEVSEYLSRLLAKLVQRDYSRVVAEMGQEAKE